MTTKTTTTTTTTTATGTARVRFTKTADGLVNAIVTMVANDETRSAADVANARALRHLDRMAANRELTPVVRERFRVQADRLRCDLRNGR